MTTEELLWFVKIHEALLAGEKITSRDINTIYELIPGAPLKKARNGKIKAIHEYFDTISTETISRYLVEQQLKQKDNGNG
jgi:hypothetical protein